MSRYTRRQVLRSAAATLWLPVLPSLLPRAGWAATSPDPKRMLLWFVPNGILEDQMLPTATGVGYDLPEMLASFAPLQDRISVISGLANRAAMDDNLTYSTHEDCTSTLLTDKAIGNAISGPLDSGISMDQVAANQLAGQTPFPSLQLGTGEPWLQAFGNIDIYYSHISWASPLTPMAATTSPKVMFERMFAGSSADETAIDISKRNALRTSVLDAVSERASALDAKASAADRVKLDQYLTGVRDLELRITALEELECETPTEPAEDLGFAARIDAMSDLMVVALQCDFTRIMTFMAGATTSSSVYTFLGQSQDHHTLSHNWVFDNQARIDLLAIQAWQVATWVSLAQKLADIPEGSTDLLANTAMVLTSEFSDSNQHVVDSLPLLLAGGEGGGIGQGQHRRHVGTPHSNLWRTLLEFLGADSTGFGENATGSLDLS